MNQCFEVLPRYCSFVPNTPFHSKFCPHTVVEGTYSIAEKKIDSTSDACKCFMSIQYEVQFTPR